VTADEASIATFFAHEPEVVPLFDALSRAILARHPATEVRVQASQVSFRAPRPFCAAWLPIRRGIKGRPEHYLVVSFGLDREILHPRLVDTVEPYPGRWTHHTIVATTDDIDAELLGWIDLAWAWKNGDGETKTEA
jgi:hypothetical protein